MVASEIIRTMFWGTMTLSMQVVGMWIVFKSVSIEGFLLLLVEPFG